MDTDERLQRIESDIHEMKADMSDIKVSLAEIKATLPPCCHQGKCGEN